MAYQHPINRIFKIAIVLLSLLAMELAHIKLVFIYACDPAYQLFRENYDLDTSEVPLKVDITGNGALNIYNRTDQPLYLVSAMQFHLVKDDPNWFDKQTIKQNKNEPPFLIESRRANNISLRHLYILDPNINQDANLEVTSHPNPIYLPPPQSSQLHLVLGAEQFEVPFTVSYKINRDVDVTGCGSPFLSLWFILLAGGTFIGFGFVGFLMLKYRNQIFPD